MLGGKNDFVDRGKYVMSRNAETGELREGKRIRDGKDGGQSCGRSYLKCDYEMITDWANVWVWKAMP